MLSELVPLSPGSDSATGMEGTVSAITAVCCSCKDTVLFYLAALHTGVFSCIRKHAAVQLPAEGRDLAHHMLQA